ncbi:acetate--CoA ligase family protein [Halobaculum sp. MBLA0147]|uniref:acetate--CoA ligase family protein n=1 Tax=Halobaculum sp. MBLA0147 TaxID=3079934 RepID=UPI003524C232
MFAPERVAVVGATEREGSVGRAVTANLLADFDGEVVPVNPNRESVLGEPCVDSVADSGADLAVVAVPPAAAVETVAAAGEAGIRNLVVLTAGFGETGGEGVDRERRLTELAAEYDLTVVGPNSLGVASTPVGLNATFGPSMPDPGSISFMSQSGAFVTAVIDWAFEQDIGFRHVVSLGNKAALDETDLVAGWGDDDGTDVIVGYLESVDDGERFVETAREVTADTPVVVIKSGRTDAGAGAAASHTGAIAGNDRAYEVGLREAGVLRADSAGELFDAARALSGQPLPDEPGVAVVTNAGGPGVMATDAVGDSEALELADLTDETVEALDDALPAEANRFNPVDVIGDAGVERFRDALEITLADDTVGSVVVLSAPTATLSFDELAEAIADVQADAELPVAACLMGGERVESPAEILSAAGIPTYFDPSRAVGSLDTLARYREIREREASEPRRFDVDRERVHEVLSRVRDRQDNRLGVESMAILDAYGVPTPDGEIVDGPERAQAVAAEIDGPVVMKIVSPDILHKSDIGGVAVGVADEEVADTYERLVTRARNYQPGAAILGVQVQASVDVDAGVETIVGINRDPQFGPLVVFGLGGIFVETLNDTAAELAPVDERSAREMTAEIEAAPLLRGARGREPTDLDAVVETIQRLAQLADEFPAIVELDVNPLIAQPDGAVAIDLAVTVDPDALPETFDPDAFPEATAAGDATGDETADPAGDGPDGETGGDPDGESTADESPVEATDGGDA